MRSKCPICRSQQLATGLSNYYHACKSCGYEARTLEVSGLVANSQLVSKPRRPSILQREQVAALRPTTWAGQSVIDIGCGQGGFLQALAILDDLPEGSFGVELHDESRKVGIE